MWKNVLKHFSWYEISFMVLLFLIAIFLILFHQTGFLILDQRGIFMEYAYHPTSTAFGNTIEYPAGAFLFFKILTVPANIFSFLFKNILQSYYFFFSLVQILSYIFLWIFSLKLLSDISQRKRLAINLFFFSLFFIGNPFLLLSTFDLLPVALTCLAIALIKKYPATSGCILAVAATVKWFPLLLFPLFLTHLHKQKGIRTTFTLACIGTGILVHLVAFLWLPPSLQMATYSFHAGRGMHAESILGNISLLFSKDTSIIYAHHSFEVVGATIPFLSWIITFMWIGLMLTCIYKGLKHELMYASAGTILAFVLFGKVFSAQFLFWMIPFITYIVGRSSTKKSVSLASLFLISIFLGPLITLHQEAFVAQTPTAILALTIRNVAIFIVFGYLFFDLCSHQNSSNISLPHASHSLDA